MAVGINLGFLFLERGSEKKGQGWMSLNGQIGRGNFITAIIVFYLS
jgi:hypothetical protein